MDQAATSKLIQRTIHALLANGAYSATMYLSPQRTIKVTRKLYRFKGRKPPSHARALELNVHDGKPNYASRLFIKQCRRAGEPFPVSRIQIQYIPNSGGVKALLK